MRWKSVVAAGGLLLAGLQVASAQEGYLEWADANGLVGPLAEPDADLDTDGITNLIFRDREIILQVSIEEIRVAVV